MDKAGTVIREVLTKDRYDHTIRVVETAITLAEKYGESMEKVKLAALFHDYAKCFTIDQLKRKMIHYQIQDSLMDFHFELWHGPVGAKIARDVYGVMDQDILNAITYHTTGRVGMSKLEYIIFVADYIEPGRNFPAAEEVRKLAKMDLRQATRKALQYTIIYLMGKDATIHPNSFLAYNALTKTIKER
jgi:predicted HD superfamily hydrolase involved in NAD metabolism